MIGFGRHFGFGFVSLGSGSGPKTQKDPDSELNSIHFSKKIKKEKKIFEN